MPDKHTLLKVLTGVKGKISDGDTLWICNDDACTKYRLCGVDSPERGKAGYKEASTALTAITDGKTIKCVPVNSGDCLRWQVKTL